MDERVQRTTWASSNNEFEIDHLQHADGCEANFQLIILLNNATTLFRIEKILISLLAQQIIDRLNIVLS